MRWCRLAKLLGSDRLVDLAPPHRVLGAGLLDDVLVARRAAGESPGIDREAAAQGELALAAPHGVLVEHRRGLVPMHGPEVVHALPVEPETALRPGHRIVLFIERFLLLARPGPRHSSAAPAQARAVPQHGRPCQNSLNGGVFPRLLGRVRQARRAPPRGSAPARRSRAGRSRRRARRSSPSGSMPVIRQPLPGAAEQTARVIGDRVGMSLVHLPAGSPAPPRRGARASPANSEIAAFDPVDPAEAGDEMRRARPSTR